MEAKIILHDTMYSDMQNEADLRNEKEHLSEKLIVQAGQDGDLKQPKTPSEYAILATNGIETEVQRLIDRNQAKYLPVSGEAIAKVIEKEADQKVKELHKEQHGLERQIPEAEKVVDANKPDLKHMALRKWVFVILVFIAGTEGFTSYGAFRHTGFTTVVSTLVSIAVAGAVAISSHFAGGWIRATKNTRQYIIRCLLILLPAVLGFGGLAVLRTHALNDVIDLRVGTKTVTASHTAPSAIAIGIFSVLLYAIAVFVSAYFFRTKEMRIQEQRYEESYQALEALKRKLQETKDEIMKVEKDKIEQMTLAVRRHEYAKHVESGLVNFAQQLSEKYKSQNIRNRTDGIPEFYKEKAAFVFNTFFNHQNHEQ